VKGDTQQGLECPLEVASAVLGEIEYLPATGDTLIVDETANCFAGRFRATSATTARSPARSPRAILHVE